VNEALWPLLGFTACVVAAAELAMLKVFYLSTGQRCPPWLPKRLVLPLCAAFAIAAGVFWLQT
jgi:hypothetical protein